MTCIAISPKPPIRRKPIRTIRKRPHVKRECKPNGFLGAATVICSFVILYCITITLVFVEQILNFESLDKFTQFTIVFTPVLLAFVGGILFQRAKALKKKRQKEQQLKMAVQQRDVAEARVAQIMKNADNLQKSKNSKKTLNIAEMFHVDISDSYDLNSNEQNYISTSEEKAEKPLLE